MPRSLAGLDVKEVASLLSQFVNGTLMARGRAITADDELERAGVDSMGLLKVLLFVESEFGFWMPDEDLEDDNVRSCRALATYICRRLGVS